MTEIEQKAQMEILIKLILCSFWGFSTIKFIFVEIFILLAETRIEYVI